MPFFRLYNAAAFANRQGVVLNARIDISWFNLGVSESACGGYFDAYKKNLAQWFRDQGLRDTPYPAYIYVHERKGENGVHSHMLWAVPPQLSKGFKHEAKVALLRVLGRRELPDKVLRVRWRAVPEPGPERRSPVTKDQWIRVQYMLKGVRPDAKLGTNVEGVPVTAGDLTEWEYQDPGRPFTKRRWGVSETLNDAAQGRFTDAQGGRVHSLINLQCRHGALDVRELYTDLYLDQAAGRRGAEPPAFVAEGGGKRQTPARQPVALPADPAFLEVIERLKRLNI